MIFLRFIHRAVAVALTLGLLLLNLRLYSRTDLPVPDVVPQLNFIGAALRDGAGERMQALFPEGFFFSHILYGLAWAQVGMRRQFVATPLGVAGVREYPHGNQGAGDVDSGPLFLGISLSASAVTLGAALVHEDSALAYPLLEASEAFGLPISWGGSKRYLFGAVPVGDAILVWSKSALPWYDVPMPSPLSPVVRWWWRLPTHALSLALVVLFWLPFRRR